MKKQTDKTVKVKAWAAVVEGQIVQYADGGLVVAMTDDDLDYDVMNPKGQSNPPMPVPEAVCITITYRTPKK